MTTQAAANLHARMRANGTYKLTVVRDWTETGKEFWEILHGTEVAEGFNVGLAFATRKEAMRYALDVLDYAYPLATMLPLVAYEHGHRKWRWVDRDYYMSTGLIRSH